MHCFKGMLDILQWLPKQYLYLHFCWFKLCIWDKPCVWGATLSDEQALTLLLPLKRWTTTVLPCCTVKLDVFTTFHINGLYSDMLYLLTSQPPESAKSVCTPHAVLWNWTCLLPSISMAYLTIIPRARMGSESIAHEAEGRMGYWLRGHEGERNNCFSKIQLVGQKYRE